MNLKRYTIVIVTHSMQQSAFYQKKRRTFHGKMIEYDITSNIFTNPKHEMTAYISGRIG